jgi:catechol 2,3-dioxygenase-like lactoylglutathione lyase family enzyme
VKPQLNHTIVNVPDQAASARFASEVLGLDPPSTFGPFLVVETGNGVSLDFMESDGADPQHYAFLVTEADFDDIFGRIRDQDIEHWADPGCTQPGEINHHDGGRGVYFREPGGHLLEIITRPYGSGPASGS